MAEASDPIARIELAIARIDAATRRQAALLDEAARARSDSAAALASATERHARLRGKVEAAVASLDALIAGGSGQGDG